MAKERSGVIRFGKTDATVVGSDIRVGDAAPEFIAHALDWSDVHGLADTWGKVRIIATVPSLETPVCDRETRRFNQEATTLGNDITVLVISTDLPYTQKRWCGAAGINQLMVLSDHMTGEFGERYGCLIKERRILRRAIFVVDRAGVVRYAAYMSALSDGPNYDEVLKAARTTLSG